MGICCMAQEFLTTGISHHNLLPHIPSICLSAVNSSPRPGIAPQSLNSSSQLLYLPGDLHPFPGFMTATRTVLFSFYLCCNRSSVSLSALNVSPLTQTIAPLWDSDPRRAGAVLLMLLFFPLVPLSYRVLRESIYSFFPVRDSCPLSAGVLHALLCLKVYC